jgi:hypothetical protein
MNDDIPTIKPGPANKSTKQIMRDRTEQMRSQREQGLTLDQIGKNFGVSRERVRQILQPFPELKALAMGVRFEQRAKTHEDKIWQVLTSSPSIDAAFENAHNNADVIVQFPDLDPAILQHYLTDRFRGSPRTQGNHDVRITNDEMLSSMRSAAKSNTSLSKGEYERWRSTNKDAPAWATIVIRFGKWNDAVSAAGLIVTHGRKKYSKKWTNEAVVEVLYRFLSHQESTNGSLRLVRFREWLEKQPQDSVPSLSLVRRYIRIERSSNWPETISALSQNERAAI